MPHEVATSARICVASAITLGGVVRCLGSKASGAHICSSMYFAEMFLLQASFLETSTAVRSSLLSCD